MAAVAIAATVVQPFSAQASVVCRLQNLKLLARAAADSAIAAAAVELSRRLAVVASYGSSRVSTSGLSAGHFDDTMKYSDRHLAGLFARPPDRVELIDAGSLGYGTGPSFG
ncbi:hypothetical protein EMIHUDRAFT_228023 [Emiliania huxleyi CCMP1516]|uniref:Uncharacterized protein n=2 Tax=Emiliania huxleyi TaxID=2903 RepID=A0A0D3KGV0_EMIH1|nr:hypothetical protein EMIHUDRAFT_228023 [Emiliania huxleyi CCMP1516]EOD34985.1 hypothetical protein EMIHUDRAFT_228023 [Emiliania huxleyi CCMP1516]|eukprot:XP_005787414.1 hypothetical protein EMIHUDRAFT_228023 [Emiliania huxleyi CCMP1516]